MHLDWQAILKLGRLDAYLGRTENFAVEPCVLLTPTVMTVNSLGAPQPTILLGAIIGKGIAVSVLK